MGCVRRSCNCRYSQPIKVFYFWNSCWCIASSKVFLFILDMFLNVFLHRLICIYHLCVFFLHYPTIPPFPPFWLRPRTFPWHKLYVSPSSIPWHRGVLEQKHTEKKITSWKLKDVHPFGCCPSQKQWPAGVAIVLGWGDLCKINFANC